MWPFPICPGAHDDDLPRELLAVSRGLVLRVRPDVLMLGVLDSDVPDVEPDVVTQLCLGQRLVARLNRLALDSTPHWQTDHPRLLDTRLHTANGDCPNPRDLDNTPQRKTKRIFNIPDGLLEVVKRLKDRQALVSQDVVPALNRVVADEAGDGGEQVLFHVEQSASGSECCLSQS